MSKIEPSTGNFFEDFRLGQVIQHATPRTLTTGDAALYQALYGRSADRYEKAALVTFVEKQQKPAAGKAVDAAPNAQAAIDPQAARAAAFVDLAHALANSNEFSYRF